MSDYVLFNLLNEFGKRFTKHFMLFIFHSVSNKFNNTRAPI